MVVGYIVCYDFFTVKNPLGHVFENFLELRQSVEISLESSLLLSEIVEELEVSAHLLFELTAG